MPHLEPSYLRYIYDGLEKGELHPDNAAALPEGLTGLYEAAFEESKPARERQKLLETFAIWSLLKKEVSAQFVAEILDVPSQEIIDFIETYSSWFTSPESGKYRLYHERFKAFLLCKLASKEIQFLSSKIINFLKFYKGNNIEFLHHKFEFYIDYLVCHSYENVQFLSDLEKIVYGNQFWENIFTKLQTIQTAKNNIRNLIYFAVFKKDWKLLEHITKVILELEQKNNILCEKIINSKKINEKQIEFCFNSISTYIDKLRFLSFISVKIDNNESEKIKLLWSQILSYVETEYVNGALIIPFWIKQKLNDYADEYKIDSLKMVLNKLDFQDINPISTSGILKSFDFLEQKKIFLEDDQNDYENLLISLNNKNVDFSLCYDIIKTPNLMDKDELLCRATLDFIDINLARSYEWINWLLTKSDFEWGGHTGPDEKYYTKNLIAKFIYKSDLIELNKINKLLYDIDLFEYHKSEIRCWISDKYYTIGNETKALISLNVFNYSFQSTFDDSKWKSAWYVFQNLDFNIEELHISERLETILKYPKIIKKITLNEINNYLKPLENDKISKAEYLLDSAIKVYNSRKELSIDIVNSAWELVDKTSDWASIFVKIETIVTALNFMPEAWIEKNINKLEVEYNTIYDEYSMELNEGLQNFYYYNPFRFSDKNILQIAIASNSTKSFLKKFDKSGLKQAIENEKNETFIRQKIVVSLTFREFWSFVKTYFLSDGIGLSIDNFWELFVDNKNIFQNITAEDVRIINVISRKIKQHFPVELYFKKSQKLFLYKDRVIIPDDWEYGSKKGFEALLSKKSLNTEIVCDAILGSPRNGLELTNTSINAVGYMLLKILNNKQLVKNTQAFIQLREEISK